MNKILFLIGFFLLIVVVSVDLLTEKKEILPEIETNDQYDLYLEGMGLDARAFLLSQKQIIYEEGLVFLKRMDAVNYNPPSTTSTDFIRDNFLQRQLIYNDANLSYEGYLFKGEDNQLHVMITYHINAIIIGDEPSSFIMLRYSNNYYSITFPQGSAYNRIDHIENAFDAYSNFHNNGKIYLYRALKATKNPIDGFVWFMVSNKEDSDESYFELVVDLYEATTKVNEQEIIFGYNAFKKKVDNQIYYIPQSKRLIYDMENNQ